MKRIPITARAKMGTQKSPLKFDYRFAKGVSDQVAGSKEFIAAGDAMGLGMDASERRIERQKALAKKEAKQTKQEDPVGDAYNQGAKEAAKSNQ